MQAVQRPTPWYGLHPTFQPIPRNESPMSTPTHQIGEHVQVILADAPAPAEEIAEVSA